MQLFPPKSAARKSKNIIKEKTITDNNNAVLCHAGVCQRRQRNTECEHDFCFFVALGIFVTCNNVSI